MALNSFDRGLQAERIVTMVEEAGENLMCVKFKGRTRHELIPADVVKKEVPLMVIEFYVKHMSFEPGQEEKEEIKRVKKREKLAKRKAMPEEEPRQKKKKDNAKKRNVIMTNKSQNKDQN